MEILKILPNHAFTKIIDPQQWIATDLTGRFPVTSNRGNKYLFILYYYNSNIIPVITTKNRKYKEFIRVFQDLQKHLTTRGLNTNYMYLYNEASP